MKPAIPDYLVEPEEDIEFRACRFEYGGRAAQAVRRLKYNRSTSLVSFMSGVVAQRVGELAAGHELVIPVPMNGRRKAWRGFNQSELLASAIVDLEVCPKALARIRNTRPQAGLSLKERQANLRGAFRADPCVVERAVILVDDVVTSGQTARECARALHEAGAGPVGIVAFAGNLT